MTTRPFSKFLALALGAGLSAAWLSTVVVGMQTPSQMPVLHSIELPTVVIVAHKASAPSATAQARTSSANNS